MKSIRRIYLYGVSFVSLLVVLWGSIGLLRSLFAGQEIGTGNVTRLAGALSLILVGLPVFGIHWWLAQREGSGHSDQGEGERYPIERGFFLYAVLLVTLVPAVQNLLSLIDRLLLQLLGVAPGLALLGGQQTWPDNLVALLANLAAAAYFYWVLRQEWKAGSPPDEWQDLRRLYRYLWLVYGLAMVFFGLQQTLAFVLLVWDSVGERAQVMLANGLALLVVGTPLWVFSGRLIQRSLAVAAERESLLRLIFLYGVVFISVIVFLSSAGAVIYELLRLAMGAGYRLSAFLSQVSIPLSLALPSGMLWAYYGRSLGSEVHLGFSKKALREPAPDEVPGKDQQRRVNLGRLYLYSLSFVGLSATFVGLQQLLWGVLGVLFSQNGLGAAALRDQIARALAALLVGLPVWIVTWRAVARQAADPAESGEYARRSLVRRSYLYLILFIGVLGVMFSTGRLLYQLLLALLGDPPANLLLEVLQQFSLLLLFAVLAVYHWMVLRRDGRLAQGLLAKRYAQYPVLIIAPDENEFGFVLADTLQRRVPGLPVAVQPLSQGAPDASLSLARAVILPADLALRPTEALRLWLQGFTGDRLVIALPGPGWYWIPSSRRRLESLARQAAQAVRQLAEDQTPGPGRDLSAWTIVLYVFAALFLLQLVLGIVIFFISLWFG